MDPSFNIPQSPNEPLSKPKRAVLLLLHQVNRIDIGHCRVDALGPPHPSAATRYSASAQFCAETTGWDRRTPVRHRYSTSAQHCANTTARDRRTPVRQRPFATPSRSHKYLQYELVFRAIPSLRVSRGLHCHIPAGLTPWDRRTLVRHHRYSASAQL